MTEKANAKLYYLVSESGCVYCVDDYFHMDQSFAKYKAYKRVKAALAAAAAWSKYMRQHVHVVDSEGNEVSE